jgi:sugar phosphate isomerase/epimerase
MMTVSEIGMFARSFPRRNAADVAQAVRAAGFALAQFNFAALGQPTLSPEAQPGELQEIASAFRQENITIWGLSATYNTIHPDVAMRTAETQQAARLIGLSPLLAVHAVTLCTGTRDRDSMWARHPDNSSAEAWHDLRTTIDALLPAAAAAQVQLGVEPEPGNVVRDAQTADRLLRELGGDAATLGIILDPGNLVTPETLGRQRDIFAEAFGLLGAATIALHAKDLDHGGPAPLGRGGLDYDLIIGHAQQLDRHLPIIIQDDAEDDAARSRTFLRRKLGLLTAK